MDEIFNAKGPQPNFRYPAFAPLPSGQNPLDLARYYLSTRAPKRASFHASLAHAAERFLRFHKIRPGKILLSKPFPRHFLEATKNYERVSLSSEQDISTMNLDGVQAALLSNPNFESGFFYPQDHYEQILKVLVDRGIPVLSEESFGLFTFSTGCAPGNLRSFSNHPKVAVCASVQPAYDPTGSPFSWLVGPQDIADELTGLSSEEIQKSIQAIQAFQIRQGDSVEEFQRRMLALEMGFRAMTDELRPSFIGRKLISIPMWPQCGFNLLLDVSPICQKLQISTTKLLEILEHQHGICLRHGAEIGEPDMVQLCFGGMNKWLIRLGKSLNTALINLEINLDKEPQDLLI